MRDTAEDSVERAVGQVKRTVDEVRPAVDKVEGAVDEVQRTTDPVLRDPVRTVTRHVEPAPPQGKNTLPAVRGDDTDRSRPALGPGQGTPGDDPTGRVPDASSDVSHARQETPADPPARARASAVTRQRTSALHTLRVADREAAPVAAAPPLGDHHPCASGSLAAAELRRCARATAPSVRDTPPAIPDLGGAPVVLLPAGLVLLGAGVVLVALGRRRSTQVVPVG